MERDGYHAVQIGFENKLRRKAIRAERGHVAADFVSKRRQLEAVGRRADSGKGQLRAAEGHPRVPPDRCPAT